MKRKAILVVVILSWSLVFGCAALRPASADSWVTLSPDEDLYKEWNPGSAAHWALVDDMTDPPRDRIYTLTSATDDFGLRDTVCTSGTTTLMHLQAALARR